MYRNDPDSTNKTTLALIIAFIMAALIFVSDKNSDRFLQVTKTSSDQVMSPVLSILSAPLRGIEGYFATNTDRKRAFAENVRLKEELYELREAQERASIMELKLARLEQILKVDSGLDIPRQKIAARAVSESEGPFVRAALINAGRNKGVKVGHPVMTVNGLYGHVVRVGGNSARVLRLSDLNSRIAIMSVEDETRAILSGNNSAFPEVSFMSDAAQWSVGDTIITSGDDGVLPRGLPIGHVVQGTKNKLRVKLNVDADPIDWIWVYPFEPIADPSEDEAEEEQSLEANIPEDKTEETP